MYYVQSLPDVEEFVYASPRQGYAQLSLAYVCRDLGRKCTVTVPKGTRYWLTDEALTIQVRDLGPAVLKIAQNPK